MTDIMNSNDESMEAFEALYQSMPPIGFLNRKKRVIAYLKVTKLAQKMVDDKVLDEDNAKYLLSVLARKYAPFQKAATMAALHLGTIDKAFISPLGFRYANDFRCNLNMLPVD